MIDPELDAMLEAAQAAATVVRELYRHFEAIPDAPASISTEADKAAQETILGLLRRRFPGDAFCAEETTASLAEVRSTGPRLWVIDPIDGTRGFARKNGEFSVMIGFVDEAGIKLGAVDEPAHERVTYAWRGGGCWRRDRGDTGPTRCQVNQTTALSAATLTQSRSRHPETVSPLVELLKPARVVETYSAGIKLALVARGEADVYLNTYDQFHDWDICAGQILVDEAGGRVSDLQGRPLRYGIEGAWQRHGLLATNSRLHEAALAAINR